MESVTLHIPPIELEWSDWVQWNSLKVDSRSGAGVIVPNGVPGVYEVRLIGEKQRRLTIGKASALRWRIKQGLVKGIAKHSSGTKIRRDEDISTIEVRWAKTDRPCAAEEELHKRYRAGFGELPKYTKCT